MPVFNLNPILFPIGSSSKVYNELQDYFDIKENEYAIQQGGEIRKPETYDLLIREQEKILYDPRISKADKREIQKKIQRLQINQLKVEFDRKEDITTRALSESIESDLRTLEFEVPNHPIAYAQGAEQKYRELLDGGEGFDGLYEMEKIFEENYADTTNLKIYIKQAEWELSKYATIRDAFDRGQYDILNEYAVVYTPFAGKIKAMRIIDRSDLDPTYSQATNLKFANDGQGNLIMAKEGESGLPVYFVRANPQAGEEYNVAGNIFNFTPGIGFRTDNPETFKLEKLRHSAIHDVPSGNFAKDSKEQLYYVNQDRSLSPIKGTKFLDELGYTEDKVYNLSPEEEMNTLPGAIEKLPLPMLEKWNREKESYNFNYWQAFKEGLRPEVMRERWREYWRVFPERVEERRRLREIRPREIKPIPEKPKWEMEEVEPTEIFERGKEFIKRIISPRIK